MPAPVAEGLMRYPCQNSFLSDPDKTCMACGKECSLFVTIFFRFFDYLVSLQREVEITRFNMGKIGPNLKNLTL